jgi:UrcA family protein
MMLPARHLSFVAAFSFCTTVPAQAEELQVEGRPLAPADGASVHVRIADLDLATADGAAQLQRRVKRAVSVACSADFSLHRDLKALNWCRRQTAARALPEVDRLIRTASRETRSQLAAAPLEIRAGR